LTIRQDWAVVRCDRSRHSGFLVTALGMLAARVGYREARLAS